MATMFDRKEAQRAIDLAHRAWEWLQWMQRSILAHRIGLDEVHVVMDDAASIRALTRRAASQLPAKASVPAKDLDDFSRYVASYLSTSFDVHERPQQRVIVVCPCMMCTLLVQLPHLRPKKLSAADQRRADVLARERLQSLARDAGVTLTPERAVELARDAELRADLATSAWVEQVLARLRGECEGPAVLALWRRFAWTDSGAPKRGFEMSLELLEAAEQRLVSRLRAG